MRLALFVLSIICYSLNAATYYVATTGADGNDGSLANPWFSVKKAVATIVGGDVVLIDDGTYSETNTVTVSKAYASEVLIASKNGVAANVVIRSNTNDANRVTVQVQTSNTTWSNLTFTSFSETNGPVVKVYSGSANKFIGCVFTGVTDAANKSSVPIFFGGGAANGITLIDCTVNCTGTNSVQTMYAQKVANVVLSNVNVYGFGYALSAEVTCTNLFFTNCSLTSVRNYGVSFVNGATNVFFDSCSITSITYGALFDDKSSNVVFNNCNVVGSNNVAIRFENAVDFTVTNSRLYSTIGYGFYQQTTNLCTNIVVSGCFISSSNDAVYVSDAINTTVSSNICLTQRSHGVAIGKDGNYLATEAGFVTGMVSNCVIVCTNGHGLLLGSNCTNAAAVDNLVRGGDNGIVIKENEGCSAIRNTVYAGTASGIYAKGSTNTLIAGNLIYGQRSASCNALQAIRGDSSNPYSGLVCSNNFIVCLPTGPAYNFSPLGDGSTNTICDFNTIFFMASPTMGVVRSNSSLTTIESARSSWTNSTSPNNDSHSWYGPMMNPGFSL